jgi:hypothetical protein
VCVDNFREENNHVDLGYRDQWEEFEVHADISGQTGMDKLI